MSPSNFETILKKIDPYTEYIYLHVKGEPLLHPRLEELLLLASKYGKKVNITTNGTLLKEKENILCHSALRQLNLSLHSENKNENYLDEIFEVADRLSQKCSIVYRLWTLKENKLDEKSTKTVEKIISRYHLSPEIVEKLKKETNIKIKNNIYVNKANEFLWPSATNSYEKERGYCHALKDQIAILVDGTVVPCCLDGEGQMKLGNIFEEDLEDILNRPRVKQIIRGFQNRKVTEDLCKHCNFKEKFDRKDQTLSK